jgi:hypothetical protein
MKVSILVILIVLPMLTSIGLYCYSFLSTRWSSIDENLLHKYSSTKGQQRLQTNNNIQFQLQTIRHAFRSRFGLFGYCLDYKWLNLLTIKPQLKSSSAVFCRQCNQSVLMCPETGCCVS